ncbi:hypothetical protein FB45DRAFT_160337 [Roridomyces roridus]|uniref:Secreted protein n=1 Tax=Roridomyces roridus TaxID=1738132 RepID=A0AAD7FHR4_9AGAR|nr:hypothetical protein FB45DRAFT_160337 [Roridomyces roridus]
MTKWQARIVYMTLWFLRTGSLRATVDLVPSFEFARARETSRKITLLGRIRNMRDADASDASVPVGCRTPKLPGLSRLQPTQVPVLSSRRHEILPVESRP